MISVYFPPLNIFSVKLPKDSQESVRQALKGVNIVGLMRKSVHPWDYADHTPGKSPIPKSRSTRTSFKFIKNVLRCIRADPNFYKMGESLKCTAPQFADAYKNIAAIFTKYLGTDDWESTDMSLTSVY